MSGRLLSAAVAEEIAAMDDGSASAALEEFCAHARQQRQRVEWLLACGRRLGVLPGRRCAQRAQVRWTADITDPEFKKNLRTFHGLIGEAERMAATGGTGALATRLGELHGVVALPSDVRLTLKLLLVRRFQLERLLLQVGDEEYLRWRAAGLYTEGEGTAVTWARMVEAGLFPPGPPALLADAGTGAGAAAAEQARRLLAWLIEAKDAEDLPLRARRELKQRVLARIVLPLLVVTTALFGVAVGVVDGDDGGYLLAAAAGAAGAALGGLLKLRDEINLGAQLRVFAPFFAGQVVVGVAAGLLVSVVVSAGIVRVGGGDGGLAAFGFVAGFSEAALLGLVVRLAETFSGSAEAPRRQRPS